MMFATRRLLTQLAPDFDGDEIKAALEAARIENEQHPMDGNDLVHYLIGYLLTLQAKRMGIPT